MANQNNYKQLVGTLSIGDSINRTISPEEYVIKTEINQYFLGLDLEKENVELHFYNQGTDQLVYSAVVPLNEEILSVVNTNSDDGIHVRLNFFRPGEQTNTVAYSNENSLQEKYLSDLPAGTYDVIINFFSDEIGTYNDANWRIKRVSPSKKEIVLHARPNQQGTVSIDEKQYGQFVIESIFGQDFQQMVMDLFQTNLLSSFKSKLNSEQLARSNTVSNFDSSIQIIINDIYQRMVKFVDSEFENKRFRIERQRFLTALNTIISESIEANLQSLVKQDAGDSGEIPLVVNAWVYVY